MSSFEEAVIPLLTQGTKEYLIVDVEDQSLEMNELLGTAPRFDVEDSAGVLRYTQEPGVIDPDPELPMRLRCLIDTSDPTPWPTGDYKLFITFDTSPEVPRIGPYIFVVID